MSINKPESQLPGNDRQISRRQLLRSAVASAAGIPVMQGLSFAGATRLSTGQSAEQTNKDDGTITFGVITDLHHGLAADASERLQAFMKAVDAHDDLAFIVQMGDFCHPTEDAREFVSAFDQFPGRKVHVLGNHDMDKGSKSQTMRHWGMESRFGSFDAGAFHFVVLDLNNLRDIDAEGERYTPYENANFYVDAERRGWCDPEQLAWLADDLAATDKQTIIFSHQPLGFSGTGENLHQRQQEVLDVLHAANDRACATNREAGQKVVACLSGHLHVDRHERNNGIHCLSINSASYHWAGGMHPYADPLFCFVTLNPAGRIYVHGQHSSFVNPHPWDQGLSPNTPGITASISDRAVVFHGDGQ